LLWDPPNRGEEVIPQASLYSPAITAVPSSTYLSDLNPTFSQNNWGPYQRDRSNGETGANDGHTISLGGIKFSRGLGVHARSELRYALAAKYTTFLAVSAWTMRSARWEV
jgi:alpha-galactosidase